MERISPYPNRHSDRTLRLWQQRRNDSPSLNNMVKKKSVSSRHERRIPADALFTTPLTLKQHRELEQLALRPDSKIDYADAPDSWEPPSDIQVGRFYRPVKRSPPRNAVQPGRNR